MLTKSTDLSKHTVPQEWMRSHPNLYFKGRKTDFSNPSLLLAKSYLYVKHLSLWFPSASTFRGARNLGVSVEPSLMKPHRGNMYRTCRLPRFSYVRSFNLTVLSCLMRTSNVLNAFEMLRTLHWLKMPRRACARYAMCQPCSNIVWWYNWVHTSRWATTWIVSQSCSNK